MYVVAGATGSLGGKIATHLLNRGDSVRILVRPSSPLRETGRFTSPEALSALGAEAVEADFTRPETLADLVDGAHTVITTASGTKRDEPDTLTSVDIAGTTALAQAAAAAGVGQFVYLSALGADPDAEGIFKAKGLAEQGVRDAGVPYTFLRPTKYMQDWIGFLLGAQLAQAGRVQIVGPGDIPVSFVHEDDVAALGVAVLGRDDAIGSIVPLAAEVSTYRELAERVCATAGGAPIGSVDVGESVDTVDPSITDVVTGLLTMAATSPPYDETTPDVAETYGITLRSIDEFLREVAA